MSKVFSRGKMPPVGRYESVAFGGFEPIEKGQFGRPAYRAFWPVSIGGVKHQAEKIVGTDPRVGTAFMDLVGTLLGREIGPDEEIDLDALIGIKCDLIVTKSLTEDQTSLSSIKLSAPEESAS